MAERTIGTTDAKEALMKRLGRVSLAVALTVIISSGVAVKITQAQEGKIVPYVPTPQAVVDRMLELAMSFTTSVRATAASSSPRRRSTVSRQ